MLNDGDTGYHIRAGEYIIENLSIPKKDIFSYHYPPLAWTAHEWLSEVIMALIHKISGLTGIVLFFSFLIALSYYIFFKILKRYETNIFILVLLTLLVISSSQIHWLARPHIFSLFLFIIWYYLLDEFQYRNRNYLFFMPLLMLLWVNLHGGFISGFILLAIYLFGNIVSYFRSKDEGDKKKIVNLTFILSLCLLATLINPYGYHILLFPFKLTSNKFIMDNVNEFLSPNFHEPMFFTVLLFMTIGVLALSKKRLNAIELMLILLFIYMPLYSIRYVPFFAVISAPIISKHIQTMLEEGNGRIKLFIKNRAMRISSIESSTKGLLLPILSTIFVLALSLAGEIRFGFDKKTKPVDAVEFIKKENIKGNMFNNDEFGDYIIYAAWPQYKVFFDGRSDMYGTEKMKEYFEVTRIKPDIDKVLEKYKIDWIIYDSGSSLSVYLLQKNNWKLIYSDSVADIFVRDIEENHHLIEKYREVKPYKKEEKERER